MGTVPAPAARFTLTAPVADGVYEYQTVPASAPILQGGVGSVGSAVANAVFPVTVAGSCASIDIGLLRLSLGPSTTISEIETWS